MEPKDSTHSIYGESFHIFLYALSLLAFICVFVIKRRQMKLPPGPAVVPFLGSITFFRDFKRRRYHVLSEMESKYGKCFSVRAGTQLIVFLNGFELVREAFVKQADVFHDRPNWLPSLQQGLVEGRGLVWQDGIRASQVRKFAHQALREFGVGKQTLEQKIMLEVEEISQCLIKVHGETVVLKSLMKKSITNVIHDVVFGTRFHYNDEKLAELLSLLDEFFKVGLFIPKNFLPRILCKLLPQDEKIFQKKQEVNCKLRQYIYQSIDDHKNTFDEADIRDFIDMYIMASKEPTEKERGNNLSQGEIFRTILDLFLAGSETTAATLDWCFLFMVKYPDVQERCFQEIKKLTSLSRDVRNADKGELPYVEATVLEVQRLAAIVPLGLPHVNWRETYIGGFRIPEKSIVFGNLYSCLRDPDVWKNPTEFQPERHLDVKGNVIRSEHLVQFSIGSRKCLGETVARMEIFLIFTNLLQKFTFTTTNEGTKNLSVNTGKSDHPIASANEFDVVVTERLSDEVRVRNM